MNKKQVILAMSGGVDSSTAAYLLKKKGYSVIGITFKLWPREFCGSHGEKSCCSVEAINDARSVCAKLDIPHYLIDCSRSFKQDVIDYFLNSYRKGLTPNPCILCNEKIKFPILLKKANEIGARYIATGHYARCAFDKNQRRFFIKEAKDKNKDQSYVLFSLNQDILSRLILPLGEFTKKRIRAIAKRSGLKSFDRPESQEICFVTDDNLERFLSENLGKDIRCGEIKDQSGKVLAQHQGTCFFTIGQRRGLRVPYGRPIYVVDIIHKRGDIIVGEREDTFKNNINARNASWVKDIRGKKRLINIYAKIRYKHPKAKAAVKIVSPVACQVLFSKPQPSPTPGQAVVFYEKDKVIGGGWIR